MNNDGLAPAACLPRPESKPAIFLRRDEIPGDLPDEILVGDAHGYAEIYFRMPRTAVGEAN